MAAAPARRLVGRTQGRVEGRRASQAADLDGPVEHRQSDGDADVADDDDRRRDDERDDSVGVVDGRHQVTIERLQPTTHSTRVQTSLTFL